MNADPLDELLRVEGAEQVQQLARQLVQADADLMVTLGRFREVSPLSVRDIAERMGVTEHDVIRLERADANPRLSTLRRYALAIGVLVEHKVTAVCGCCSEDPSLSSVDEGNPTNG